MMTTIYVDSNHATKTKKVYMGKKLDTNGRAIFKADLVSLPLCQRYDLSPRSMEAFF